MSRLPELSLFFPCYNEADNLAAIVADAMAALPLIAERFEIILVDDCSRDATPEVAARLVAAHPGVVRTVRHARNRGYGGALRTGFTEARYGAVAFTDGDAQFRAADLARLLPLADPGTVVVGYRLHRADPFVRRLYARLYRLALVRCFGLRVRDVDCAMKLFPTEALSGLRVRSDGAFFSAELLLALQARGIRIAEVGVPHYPRTAGSPTGAKLSVILRAIRDFWWLRLARWFVPTALARAGRALR